MAGNRSLPLVLLISVFVGMILAMQSAYQLEEFNGKALCRRSGCHLDNP